MVLLQLLLTSQSKFQMANVEHKALKGKKKKKKLAKFMSETKNTANSLSLLKKIIIGKKKLGFSIDK